MMVLCIKKQLNLVLLRIFFLSILFTWGCDSNKEQNIYYNQSIENTHAIASQHRWNYCVILLDSTQKSSNQYRQKLENVLPLENAIYNIVDVNAPIAEWYVKWLCPISLPLTCVFSSNGTLIDLIPGATKESFLYTKNALLKEEKTEFHYVNRFNKKKEQIIPLFDQILKCNIDLEQGIFTELNDSILDSLKYPYPYYLGILGNMINNDTINAKLMAENMIKLETPYFLSLYKDEFIKAKKTINPKFDISNEPNIRVREEVITLSNHKVGETIPFDITIYNDGKLPLKVYKIFKSCTCLKLDGTDDFNISSKDSAKVHITFKTEQQGEIIRDVFITSNAINIPILYVKILANIM